MREASPIFSTLTTARAEGLSDTEVERRVWERHGTTCALLALDSSGMTRLSRSHGIVEFLTRYMEMRDVAERCLHRHRCLAWRCFADNLFAEFPTVDAALACALEIHDAVERSGIRVGGRDPFRVCIGIGYGRVLDDGAGGKMGEEMNVVAKLGEEVAEPGDTLLTEAAYAALQARDAVPLEKTAVRLAKLDAICYRVTS